MRAYPTLLSLDSPHWISYLKENLKAPQRPTTILDREYAAMLYHTLLSKDLEALGIISPEALILSLSHWHPFIKELEAFLTMQENALSFLPQSPGSFIPVPLKSIVTTQETKSLPRLGTIIPVPSARASSS